MSKKIIYLTIVFFIVTALFGAYYYQKIFGTAIDKEGDLYITSKTTLEELSNKLQEFGTSSEDFLWLAKKKKFKTPKAGKYFLQKGMNRNEVINLLRSGNQVPIYVSFNNQDTVEKLAKRIAEQIEADSTSIINAIYDSEFLQKNKLNKKTVLGIFIPNSYELYWNTSAKKFRDKMLAEYQRFWNTSRTAKAKANKMTKQQVLTLASIVQKETAQKRERPIVAGLYMNRLRKGMPLQADPTVIYCIRELKGQDFQVKRVLTKDLQIESPYNTYKHIGLPPSLISMPDISAIDAVLNYKKHGYYYMCASIDNIGFHEFAKTLSQHNRNAFKYQNWINKQGIHR